MTLEQLLVKFPYLKELDVEDLFPLKTIDTNFGRIPYPFDRQEFPEKIKEVMKELYFKEKEKDGNSIYPILESVSATNQSLVEIDYRYLDYMMQEVDCLHCGEKCMKGDMECSKCGWELD